MLHDNLLQYRKILRLSQEEIAAWVGVSRQAYAKWESGDTVPELKYCSALASFFGITLDELVADRDLAVDGPPGKHILGVVVPDANGMIRLPPQALRLLGIAPGERILLLGDENQGLAVVPYDVYKYFAGRILEAGNEEV